MDIKADWFAIILTLLIVATLAFSVNSVGRWPDTDGWQGYNEHYSNETEDCSMEIEVCIELIQCYTFCNEKKNSSKNVIEVTRVNPVSPDVIEESCSGVWGLQNRTFVTNSI